MSGSGWELCARDLDFPGYFIVSIPADYLYTFSLTQDAAFLPALVWQGGQITGVSMTQAWLNGWAEDD